MASLRSVGSIAAWTMTSRVLGLARDVMIASLLGTSIAADAFVVAFKLPNLFRRLMGDGAVAAGVVPALAPLDPQARRETAGQAAAIFGLALMGLTACLMLVPGPLVQLLTGGFPDRPEAFSLATHYTFATLPYLTFVGLAALLGGVLNASHRFSAAAAAPIVLNLVLLGAMYIPGTDGETLARAVTVGGALQLLLTIIAARHAGLLGRLKPTITPNVRKLLFLMVPAILTAGLTQINLLADLMITARMLPEGSLSILFYADRLYTLPAGLAGIAIGTALLPKLSSDLAHGQDGRDSFSRSVEFALLLTMPAAVGLFLLAWPIVRLIYGHGAFDATAVAVTSMAPQAYAAAIPLLALSRLFTAACHARRDMGGPLRIAVVLILVNVALDLWLAKALGVTGIALATSLTALLGVLALGRAAHRHGVARLDRLAWRRLGKAVLATLVMTIVVAALARLTVSALPLVFAGMLAYAVALLLLRVYSTAEVRALLAKP